MLDVLRSVIQEVSRAGDLQSVLEIIVDTVPGRKVRLRDRRFELPEVQVLAVTREFCFAERGLL